MAAEVHLEEPVLSVHVALGGEQVSRLVGVDLRDAVAVADHLHVRVQAGQLDRAVVGGEGMADDEDAGPGHHQEQGGERDSGHDDDSQQATHGPNLENAARPPQMPLPWTVDNHSHIRPCSRSTTMITELEFVPVPATRSGPDPLQRPRRPRQPAGRPDLRSGRAAALLPAAVPGGRADRPHLPPPVSTGRPVRRGRAGLRPRLDPCPGFAGSDVPRRLHRAPAVLRPYDATGQMLDGVLAEPGESEGELEAALRRPGRRAGPRAERHRRAAGTSRSAGKRPRPDGRGLELEYFGPVAHY